MLVLALVLVQERKRRRTCEIDERELADRGVAAAPVGERYDDGADEVGARGLGVHLGILGDV